MAADVHLDGLRLLHDPLIARLWPADRVLLGCRTSKWLRALLLGQAERVVFKSAVTDIADRRSRKNRLPPNAFPGHCNFGIFGDGVRVEILATHCSRAVLPILTALQSAIHHGWRGSIAQLQMRGNELGDSTSTAVRSWCDWSDSLCTDAEAVQLLQDILPQQRQLQRLDLGYNHLDQHWAEAFSKLPVEIRSLSHLSLAGNQVTDEGVQHLLPWLRSLENLTHLHFGSNELSNEGASYLSEALRGCPRLTELDLSGNLISADGADALAASLRAGCPLTFLDLSQNELSNLSAASGFCSLLSQSPALTYLNLEGNNCGDAGAEALARGLSGCDSLVSIILGHNSIASASFGPALQGLSALAWLDLSCNSLGWAEVEALCEALLPCTTLLMLDLNQNTDVMDDEPRFLRTLPPAVRSSLEQGLWKSLVQRPTGFPVE